VAIVYFLSAFDDIIFEGKPATLKGAFMELVCIAISIVALVVIVVL